MNSAANFFVSKFKNHIRIILFIIDNWQYLAIEVKKCEKKLDLRMWNVLSYNGEVGIAICELMKKRYIAGFYR